jgi:hypothetical protein
VKNILAMETNINAIYLLEKEGIVYKHWSNKELGIDTEKKKTLAEFMTLVSYRPEVIIAC